MLRTALVALVALGIGGCVPRDLETVKQAVREAFPDVEYLSTAELARRLEREPPPLLLDVRQEEEFAVSHLPGARRIEPGSGTDAVAGIPRDSEIVVYCSVGHRSADFANTLREAGFKNVRNLEGSIFQWANEGRPLSAGDKAAQVVHPYDERWGRLLDEKRRANLRQVRP